MTKSIKITVIIVGCILLLVIGMSLYYKFHTETDNVILYGHVYDNTTLDMIAGATISIGVFTNGGLGSGFQHIKNITTNIEGRYSVALRQLHNDPKREFPYQEYTLTAIHKNFISDGRYYGHANFNKNIDFYLKPGGIVKGVVYDNNSNPLANASVGIYNSDFHFVNIYRTDNNGRFYINEIKLGTYNLIASRLGFENHIKQQIQFNKWDELLENISMNNTLSNITLQGKVTYLAGNEYIKMILNNSNNEISITTTDKDGNFEASLFSTGNYTITAIPYFGISGSSSIINESISVKNGENYKTIEPQTITP